MVSFTQNKQYTLYGMVNHWGSLGNGHYTATLWSKKHKAWYEFNDARVYQVSVLINLSVTMKYFQRQILYKLKCFSFNGNAGQTTIVCKTDLQVRLTGLI